MGHPPQSLPPNKHYDRLCYGGVLRQQCKRRGHRPLSSRDPHHVVFKVNKHRLKSGSLRSFKNFPLILGLINRWARYFGVRVEQVSVQNDHVHMMIRAHRRRGFLYFFRVVAGQIAQVLEKEGHLKVMTDTPHKIAKAGTGLWKYRPFSRVVRGHRAYKTIRNYIQLNEKEATREIPYRKERLRGMTARDWGVLWT